MPEKYRPKGSNVEYTVPTLDEPADGPLAFRDFADSIPQNLSPAIVINRKTANYTLAATDNGSVVSMDTTAGDLTVTLPANSPEFNAPIGAVIVVANFGKTRNKKVTISAASGVTLRDLSVRTVELYRMAALLQVEKDSWVINAGTGGAPAPSVPTAPNLVSAVAEPARAVLTWEKPVDDGGSPLTGYTVEVSKDAGKTWTVGASFDPTKLQGTVSNLTVGATYQVRVKASNSDGFSEPSNSLQVIPLDPTVPDLVVTWNSVGKFKITNFSSKYKYSVTCTTGTGSVDGSGIVTLTDANTVGTITCTYFESSKTKKAERKAYTNHFVETQPFHCDNCHGPCTGCCGGGTFHPGECGGWPDCYFACCACGYYVGDDYRGEGYTWSGGSGAIPPAPDGNEWWKVS